MSETETLPVIQIGIVVITALIGGILFNRFKQSSALGYIAAGVLLGPMAFNVLGSSPAGITAFFGEIGLTMLLFYLGLELNIKRFRETGAVATVLAFVEMLVAFVAGFFVAKAFGFANIEALVLGAMLTATSTVITGKFLIERKLIDSSEGRLTISVLILEDFFAVLVLVLIYSLTQHQGFSLLALNALAFVVALFFVVSKISKHVLNLLNSMGQADQMWLYGIGVFLTVSFFGSTYLGLSPALGAYFAGFALAETPYGERIKKELSLFREFFVLFFFVSFGATASLPTDWSMLPLLVALAAGYVLAKLVAHGVTGTVLGLDLTTAVTGGILMSPVGEFAIIIATAAAPILPHGSEILSLAFLLTLLTAGALPILFDRRAGIIAAFGRAFPLKLRQESRALQTEMRALDKLARDVSFQNAYVRSLSRLFTHLAIAVSIVYMSYLIPQFALPYLGFIPAGLSPGLLVLPLIIWPVYKFIVEVRLIAREVSMGLLENTFGKNKGTSSAGLKAADLVMSIILTAVGLAGTLYMYSRFPENYLALLIPATYTLLSLLYLGKSFYSLIDEYEAMEAVMGIEGLSGKEKRLAELSKEFTEHARYFQQLHEERQTALERIQAALETQHLSDAKTHLVQFKRRETAALVNLFDFSGLQRFPKLKSLVKSGLLKNKQFEAGIGDIRTRAAFQRYLSTHLKPHVFEPPAGSAVQEAAASLIERDLQQIRKSPQQTPASTAPGRRAKRGNAAAEKK